MQLTSGMLQRRHQSITLSSELGGQMPLLYLPARLQAVESEPSSNGTSFWLLHRNWSHKLYLCRLQTTVRNTQVSKHAVAADNKPP